MNVIFPIPNDYEANANMQEIRLKIREEAQKLKDTRRMWFFEETRPDFYQKTSPFTAGPQGQSAIIQALSDAVGLAVLGVPVETNKIQIDPTPIPSYKSAYENAPFDPEFPLPDWLPDPNTPNTPRPPLIGNVAKGSAAKESLPPGVRHASSWLKALFETS
jgi:hypothetical protein